jgi:NAD(P)H-flavin reductase
MQKKRIFFMAGGSGITPIYQTIQEILKMNDEKIEMIVLVANKSEEDIVLRKEMEEWQPHVKVHFILDTPP